MKYSDPDGDSGYITYSVYNASGSLVQSGRGGTVASGADSIWYANAMTTGSYHWSAVATDSHGASSGTSATQYVTVNEDPGAPSTSGALPASGSEVPTVSPTLTIGAASDPEGDQVGYQFSVYAGSACSGTPVATSDWQTSVSWAVPSTALLDGQTYTWCVQSRDFVSKLESSWQTSSPLSFTVALSKLGSQPYWPMWHGGGLQVNESTGNLVLAAPGPSFPTAAGTLGLSFVYNLLDTRPSVFGSSQGAWTLADDSGAPAELIDHSVLSGDAEMDSVERVEQDGSSTYYGAVTGTDRYTSPPGDLSVLTMIGSGSTRAFQLNDPDGSTYQFGPPDATTGVASLTGAEVVTANGQGRFVYGFTGGRLTSIAAEGKDSGGDWETIATLNLTWGCTGALLCVTGPDDETWQYVGGTDGGQGGDLASVSDGVRTVLAIGYDSSGRPDELQDANDLDPADASPGYLSDHSIAIAYGTGSRGPQVATIADTNVRLAGGGTPQTLTTSFDYSSSTCGGATFHGPQQTHSQFAQPAATGCTSVTSPDQYGQPSPQPARVFYDNLGQPVEIDSPLETSSTDHDYVLYAYDSYDTLEWSEDGDGGATDNTYSADTHALTETQAPDPKTGGLGRPTTHYRYDEETVGGITAPGPPLTGLQASYYDDNGAPADFASYPAGVENDPTVDSGNWTSGQPPFLGGQTTNFAVRWTGEITIPTGGAYLATIADGGSEVTVDGTAPVIDQWSGQTVGTPVCSQLPIPAGTHQIVVEYNETSGSPSVKLEWDADSCPSSALATVPTSALAPEWLNQTSVVSPPDGGSPIISFSHYADPATHEPDYTLDSVGGSSLITSYSYDNWGRITGKVLPNGNTGATIGSDGSLSGAGDPASSDYGTTYSYYGPTDTKTTPAHIAGTGCPSSTTAPQLGLLETVQQHGIAAVSTVYDAAGDPVSITRGAGRTVDCYDGEGNLIATKAPGDSDPSIYSYDPDGNQLAATHTTGSDDTAGSVSSSYNEDDEPLAVTDANGAVAAYSYDPDGNVLARTTSPPGTSTLGTTSIGPSSDSFAAGRKYVNAYTLGSGASVTKLSVYLAPSGTSGNQVIEGVIYTDSGGAPGALQAVSQQLRFYSTDSAGWYDLDFAAPVQLSAGNWWIGVITGNTAAIADFRYTAVTSSRDWNGDTYSNGPSNPFGTASVDDERMSLYASYGSADTTSYSYDAADQLTGETDPAGHTYSFYYDDQGNLRGSQYPNGTFSWVDRNPDGWILDDYNRHGTLSAGMTSAPADSQGSPLADYSYSYAENGDKTSQTQTNGATETTTDYSYDSLGRLDQTLLPDGTCRNYSYDPDSNRTQIQESPSGCAGTFTTTATYTHTPGTNTPIDALTSQTGPTRSFAYDNDGNTTARGTDTLTWDGYGRLSGGDFNGTTITYTYDPTGQLETRTTTNPASTTRYLLGDLYETDATGTITTSYTDGPAGDLAQYTGPPSSGSTVSYLYYNAHGDLAATANTTGTSTASDSYDPFGTPDQTQPADSTVHGYVGADNKQTDTTNNLILMGARPYDPTLGRFLSIDPIDGGSPNNYDYTAQNPINNTDPDGLIPINTGWDQLISVDNNPNGGGENSVANGSRVGYTPLGFSTGPSGLGRVLRHIGKAADRFVKRNFDTCLEGAVIGAVGGPEGAAFGCMVTVLTEYGQNSKYLPIRVAAYGYSLLDAKENVEDVEMFYERVGLYIRYRVGNG